MQWNRAVCVCERLRSHVSDVHGMFVHLSNAVLLGSCCRSLLMYERQVFYYTTNTCRCYCIIVKTTRDALRIACNCNNRQHVFRKALTTNSSD